MKSCCAIWETRNGADPGIRVLFLCGGGGGGGAEADGAGCVAVNVPGGQLLIDWREDGVWMEGFDPPVLSRHLTPGS